MICKIEGCDKEVTRYNLCIMHIRRIQRHGSTNENEASLRQKPRDMPAELWFWSKVDIRSETECWEWEGGYFYDGYGAFWLNTKMIRVPRLSWTYTNGDITDGLWVLHKCDNPPCCNPNHLFLGTYQDNVDDMITKERRRNQYEGKIIE